MCSALAITTSVTNAIGMGLSVTAVLICSNLLISLLRRVIMPQVRIAAFIVIISGFVTAVELLIKAYLPALDKSLGLFIPLIVVNCIILARAESFASKNGPIASVFDGFAMGLGYTAAITVTAAVRELLGTGKILAAADGSGGIAILGSWYSPREYIHIASGSVSYACVSRRDFSEADLGVGGKEREESLFDGELRRGKRGSGNGGER